MNFPLSYCLLIKYAVRFMRSSVLNYLKAIVQTSYDLLAKKELFFELKIFKSDGFNYNSRTKLGKCVLTFPMFLFVRLYKADSRMTNKVT